MECKFSANGGQNELGVRIGDQEIPKSDRFRYLGSILQNNGELDGDSGIEVHVQRRPTDAPGRRSRGRPRKTLEDTLRKDLEYLDLTEDMTQNRAQ
ncbi:hypothetical protein DVH24_016709 [Malus domestica]|uniref:Uncharacterized protein n=1 Tax=Malus domestica TaxID=3750 RepID=A0A498HWG2_MALDO|nr:hypothetical protein DVH24_016709 [Malus domestica]